MAEEKAKRFTEDSHDVSAVAYLANYGAHRVGISKDESCDYYTRWAKSGGYEKDLAIGRYNGPVFAAQAVAEFFPRGRNLVRILDVAAGTGFVGEQLKQLDFTNVDALEPSEGMVAVARKKNVYKNVYLDFLNGTKLTIPDGSYDCCVIAGGMGEGHIPCSGLRELIRITKQGGLVCIVMREEYLQYVEEYKDRLEPLLQKWEADGLWKLVSREIVKKYSFDNNGVVFKYSVC
ncbi:methyltransferase-like protein 27 isoform X2 [Gigantopelta aegis]|nr:methyltransferase-like protein 27 isoform X2 [Gigantopelta aegis]XP_041368161.1 methyltransferase-like protein 27 isoform X2 [Gigantopelta aegis]